MVPGPELSKHKRAAAAAAAVFEEARKKKNKKQARRDKSKSVCRLFDVFLYSSASLTVDLEFVFATCIVHRPAAAGGDE